MYISPLKPEFTSRDAYRLETLDKARSTVIEDLDEWVAEIPFDVFVACLLPKIPGSDPSATVEALRGLAPSPAGRTVTSGHGPRSNLIPSAPDSANQVLLSPWKQSVSFNSTTNM